MLSIGSVHLPARYFLAPMAGVTDRPFRRLCRRAGAGLVYTEFVSAHGFVQDNRKTHSMLVFDTEERPLAVQIFGHDPEALATAAQGIAATYQPDLIDLNFGCPVHKVVRKGAGAALLKDPSKLERIAAAVVNAVDIPVTAKIRSGWDQNHIVVEEIVRRLEDVGIQALAIHPRTAKQGYQGRADWSLIAKAKEVARQLVIIGNGDIRTAEDARRMFQETGCDAVMVGRGALGRPWLFSQIHSLLDRALPLDEPPLGIKLRVAYAHFRMGVAEFGDRTANRFKKHLGWYLRGFTGAVDYRRRAFQVQTNDQMEVLLSELVQQHQVSAEDLKTWAELLALAPLNQELQLS